MAYAYSQRDKTNLDWFDKDTSKATLIRFELIAGNLRGLEDLKLHFRYPITAISGKNGTGKSTILACVACAYHNTPLGFKTLLRKTPYYTFSDFFIQSSEEIPPAGIHIRYQFLNDKWRKTPNIPTGIGLAWQSRWKFLFGRWNNYASRVDRNVVFFGIERVVPHAEKSVSKSYRRAFQKASAGGYEPEVAAAVGRILGRPYDEFYYKQHSKYRLPLVKSKGRVYSGFNMGAGENTLFEIFSTIHACTGSLFLVIDEIELGLHEEAQVQMIRELKKVCAKRHIQIICTTHSPRILGALPPEGRIHLEKIGDAVRVLPDISPKYAAGLLSGVKEAELDIYCEDEIAASVLSLALPNDIRSRVQITPIGSSAAVIRQLVAKFKDKSDRGVCGFLDGDKVLKKAEHVNLFLKALEKVRNPQDATQWIENRLAFLPGNTWPERWILSKHEEGAFDALVNELGVPSDFLKDCVDVALLSEQHDELYLLSNKLNLPVSTIEGSFIKGALEKSKGEVETIVRFVTEFLG